ncbi:hypothetical protein Tco_1344915 [Tanacetum coccineum]
MTTLAEHMIIAGAENHPPMLDKTMYNSWQSHMFLYIKGKKNNGMMLESIKNKPLVYPTIEEDGKLRDKKYVELTEQEKLQDDCDLSSIPQPIYSSQPYSPNYEETHHPQQYQHPFQTQLNHTPTLVPQNAYHSSQISQQPQVEFPQIDSGLAVQSFLPGDDPIACRNKAMAFMSTILASHFPSTNNQLRTSSNLRNHATIQDGRVIVQQVQGRQGQSFTGIGNKGNATSSRGNNAADAYDSDCDDISSAKLVLMANLSSYGSDALSKVPHSDIYQNDMINQSVQEMQYFEQTPTIDYLDNEITSDSNIIPYSQYLEETQHVVVQDTNFSAQQDSMIISMFE